jgi:hypothetical protein
MTTALVLLLRLASAPAPVQAQAPAAPFADSFATQDGLVTNAYAVAHATEAGAPVSSDWETPSGSLFVQKGVGWTGVPDDTPPNVRSTNGTGSAIFRLLTTRADFQDVSVTFDLMNEALTTSATTPAVPWDGAHVVVRYRGEQSFYYASVDRRDETALLKKKVGDTFWDLTPPAMAGVPYGNWQKVKVDVKDNPDGTVSLWLWRDGRLLAQAVDNGAGGPPLRGGGKVGIRGDNARLKFGHFHADPLGAPAAPAAVPPSIVAVAAMNITTGDATITWQTDRDAVESVEYGQTGSLGIETLWGTTPGRFHSVQLPALNPATQYYYQARARTPEGALAKSAVLSVTTLQAADTVPPTIVIVSPSSGQTIGGTIGLICNAQDNVAVAGVQWELDGTGLGAESTNPPFSFYWNSQESYNGPHSIRAIARDTSNNRTASQPINIVITGAKPRY